MLGRQPLERPSEPPLIFHQLAVGSTRYGHHGGIALIQMSDDGVEVVGPERAVWASRLPVWREHEVVDDELAAAGKEGRQRLTPLWTLKDVLPRNGLPRQ